MASSESIANGVSTPPSQEASTTSTLSASDLKRKRTDSEDAPHTNGDGGIPSHPLEPTQPSLETKQSLKDIIAVLRKHDTKPSLLEVTLPTREDDTADEPRLKRTKLSTATATTIATRIETEFYPDLDALAEDVELAATEVLAPVKAKEADAPPTQYGRLSTLTLQEKRLWTAILVFQKLVKDLVQAEKSRHRLIEARKYRSKRSSAEEIAVGDMKIKEESVEMEAISDGKAVLTVFANAPGPKQLFSSFQHPVNLDGRRVVDANGVTPPLRDHGLPSFIGTTTIPTFPADPSKKVGKGLTIGEIFAPPSTLPRLQPPKPAKSRLVTTGNSVEFVQADAPVRSNRRGDYNWCTDKLAVGQWLGYGGVDTPQEPTSPQAKRKQRDRALSTGEAFLAPTEREKTALKHAKDDALFRKVYGSFAPSYDDSMAVVPKDIRNGFWMSKLEERLAQKTVVIDPALLGNTEPQGEAEKEKELDSLKKVVDEFDPEAFEWDMKAEQAAKEMDDVLKEISDLLETLSSYQRIRNSSLNASSRTTVGQNNPITDLVGSPSTPSSGEMEVYKTLKLQLAIMVNQLPPYAVARLNGDQLHELNIKKTIIIETEDARGVMTEDEASRTAKIQAFAAAAGTQQLGRSSSSSTHAAGQYRTPAAQPPLRPTPQGYYTPQQPAQVRPAPVPYQRPGSGVQTYSSGYPTTASRPSSFTQQSANSATPRQGNYATPGKQYYPHMQPMPVKQGYNIQQQYTPQTHQRPTFSAQQHTPAPPSYQQQRSANTAPIYNSYNPQAAQTQSRTASPLTRPNSYSTPAAPQQNANYHRPGVASMGPMQQAPQRLSAATPTRAGSGSGTPQPLPLQGTGMNGNGVAKMVPQQSS